MESTGIEAPSTATADRLAGITRKPFGEITNFQSPTNESNQGILAPEVTPSKGDNNASNNGCGGKEEEEALTPLANLKMLMRVASETSRRELFKSEDDGDHHHQQENSGVLEGVRPCSEEGQEILLSNGLLRNGSFDSGISSLMGSQYDHMLTPNSLCGPQKISRKQKSLGLLCDKFVMRFPESVPEGEKCEIHLDDLAKQMGTERRRIYDIVNVLESVQMMTKIGKNLYQWHGKEHRHATLAWLKELATKLNLLDRYYEAKQHCEEAENMVSFSPTGSVIANSPASSLKGMMSPFSPCYSSTGTSPASSLGGPSPSPVERKTSLGVACQKFLMLFLIAPEPNAKINLEFAAKVIHGVNLPEAVMKTRIRRLYDIANILQSLQLIQKVQVTESHGARKPAFEYIGPDVNNMVVTPEVLQSLPATRQRHSLLTVGKNLINIPDDDPRSSTAVEESRIDLVQKTMARTTVPSYEACKPLKKRLIPDFGFNRDPPMSNINNEDAENIRPTPKLARTTSAESMASIVNEGNTIVTSDSVLGRSSSLLDLSQACETEKQRFDAPPSSASPPRFRMPSPSTSQFRRSLLRNSPINLSMDRRNAHIISPLALTASPRSQSSMAVKPNSNILPPSPTYSSAYRKISPTGINLSTKHKLSPTTIMRSPGQQQQQSSPMALKKAYVTSPTRAEIANHYNFPKIKYLKVQPPNPPNRSPGSLLGLNRGKTVIAIVPTRRPAEPSATVSRRILSPLQDNNIQAPLNMSRSSSGL